MVSAEAVLSVTEPSPVTITILRHPQGVSVPVGATAFFSVDAVSNPPRPLSYQWQRDGIDIPGATGTTYVTPPTTLVDNGAALRVNVSVVGSSTVSAEAILTIQRVVAPQTIELSPLPDRLPSESPFFVDAKASSGLPVRLWILSGPATINGNEVTLTGLGTVVLRAEQAGNDDFTSTAVERQFIVGNAVALTLEAANGTIEATPSRPEYPAGSTVSLRAKAVVGFRFDHWEGDAAGTSNPLNVFLDRSKHIIAQFTAAKSGSIDPAFDTGNSSYPSAVALASQPDGKILIAAGSSGSRLNPDGSIDPTFRFVANGEVRALALQANGKVLIGGAFTEVNGSPRAGIARLHANGALDVSFNPGEGPFFFGGNGIVQALGIFPDSRVLVGGNFGSFDGKESRSIVLLKPDGQVDQAYPSPSPFQAILNVNRIVSTSVESFLVFGDLLGGDVSYPGVIRFTTNGPNFGFGTGWPVLLVLPDESTIMLERRFEPGGDKFYLTKRDRNGGLFPGFKESPVIPFNPQPFGPQSSLNFPRFCSLMESS